MEQGITLWKGLQWVLIWFGFMLFYTLLDIKLWRRFGTIGRALNLLSMMICGALFLILAVEKGGFSFYWFVNLSWQGLLLATACAIAFYMVLDKGLDKVFERLFPASEEQYQASIDALRKTPAVSFIHVCIFTPLIEEALMRGMLLNGLAVRYGAIPALLISSLVFALLHFSKVQGCSALISGVVLGLLYLYVGSLFCCVFAHALYNSISFFTEIIPFKKTGMDTDMHKFSQ